MIALARKGMNRQEAHELIRRLVIQSISEKKPFREVLMRNDKIRSFLSEDEIDDVLKPEKYLGTAITQVEVAIRKTLEERKTRGLKDDLE